MRNLRDKTALITGAAHGIGAATARLLAEEGTRLILVDVDAEGVHALAAELGGAQRALAWVADVRDLDEVQAAVDAGIARFGGLDLLLADAGLTSYGSISTVDPADFQRVVDVNLVGVFHTVRAALPALVASNGYILVVSSLAAFTAVPGAAAYGATKAGVEQFANSIRAELAHLGVDVGSAHMSWIDTPMVQDAKADLPAFRQWLENLPWPLDRTFSVHTCAAAFVRGLDQRSRRVYVPRWAAVFGWLKPVLNGPLGDRLFAAEVKRSLPRMDADVTQLGRSLSARYTRATSADTVGTPTHSGPRPVSAAKHR